MKVKKVLVGMSGGVDSAISALLLQEAGYEVTGLYLRLWRLSDELSGLESDGSEALARDSAEKLGINFVALDAREQFKSIVITNFRKELRLGRTPNPCAVCNPAIKWQLLNHVREETGADLIATGHYARVVQSSRGFELHKGLDSKKDQSYFLARLTQRDLKHTIFPLGDKTKDRVKQIARSVNLAVSRSKESQDLCFLGQASYDHFAETYLKDIDHSGDIVDGTRLVIGKHHGLSQYTIGQRKGIRIASSHPYYVLDKDIENNRLVVGHLDELGQSRVRASDCRWINDPPTLDMEYDFKIRYQSTYNKGKIVAINNNQINVEFEKKLRDITPGQLLVCYDGDRVAGGGFIDGTVF